MALIEHPLLAVKIRDALRQEGIPFLFETRLDENVMAVRVVGQVMEREGVLRELSIRRDTFQCCEQPAIFMK